MRSMLAVTVAMLLAFSTPAQRAATIDACAYPSVESKKGLQVQMIDDAIALGIDHAAVNVSFGNLMQLADGPNSLPYHVDGRDYWFRRDAVAELDAQIGPLTRAGVVVSAILLAQQSDDDAKNALLCHSGCIGPAPNRIAAFQTATVAGRAWLHAVTSFLAQRYSGAEAPHGRIWNWIVGNEVNSHWWWYHLGKAPMRDVVTAYEQAVRIVHTAVRRHSLHGRVFVSLEHHWAKRYAAGDAEQAFPGRDFLLAFARLVRKNGELDWHVAFHPYPENLFECRFWRDRTAPDDDDADRVTFRNLPVLLRLLARDELLHAGQPRRVILSEQGFHCGDGEHGERDQAAAFALAWSIVDRLPGIDALILSRHVDHAHEGGLRLGLWTRKPDSICTPERRRRIADVFAACDTEAWPACGAFALSVIGIKSFAAWPLGKTGR